MAANIVIPSSDFNDNTVTFSTDIPAHIKLIGPAKAVWPGKSATDVSGLCSIILYWLDGGIVAAQPRIFVVQFPSTTWQPGETVTVSGPTTKDDKSYLTLVGTTTTRDQPYRETTYNSLSDAQKAEIVEAECANSWDEWLSGFSVRSSPYDQGRSVWS
ncbi:uncharacterized protein EI90DRAFT_3123833 [Cantharellus anzutake]|uniref:uncharacterized protein n=1 Tax=Cantharellus anzutake TaxID=1750568 RepID=UPI0019040874|nr:uncharacterized protein EI90DRAFT_3123833 [Cantharellus anzutake]KAF8331095.1 hypothetical protein EI90DRAFT_3123833 [Cantharellus anzutake]